MLAQAERDLDVPQGSAIGIARAYERLDGFREETAGIPLEQLREGSSREWFDFYLRSDPMRAQLFISAEMELYPEFLDLWILLGESYEAQGRLAEAADQYETVISMVPDARALRRLASLVAVFGTDHDYVESLIRRAMVLESLTEPDPGLLLIRARSLVNSGPATLDQGLAILEKLYEDARAGRNELPDDLLGQRLGTSLVHRARREDGVRAKELLLEVEEEVEEPMRKNLLFALAGVADSIR